MAKKNNVQAVNVQADKLDDFESALLQAVKANVLAGKAIDGAIIKAGFAFTEEEHAACKPISKADAAKASLAAFGIDVDVMQAETASVGTLAINVTELKAALGKLACHIETADHSSGTSLITHHIAQGLLAGEKRFSLGELIARVNATYTRPKGTPYVSTGHINTVKGLLREHGFKVHSTSGFFTVSA